jgi:hypothetical protein
LAIQEYAMRIVNIPARKSADHYQTPIAGLAGLTDAGPGFAGFMCRPIFKTNRAASQDTCTKGQLPRGPYRTLGKHNAARAEYDRPAALVFPWPVPSNPQQLNFAADF